MDYGYLDRQEYDGIPILRIQDNKNGLPFYISRQENCNQGKHRHAYIQINYICKGKLKHVINGNCFDVSRGDIFIIPPYVPHYFICEQGSRFELIEFEFIPEFINERFTIDNIDSSFLDFAYLEPFLVSEQEVRPRLNLTGNIQLEVESILNEIIREYKRRESDFQLLIKALLQKLLIIVGREFVKNITDTHSQMLFNRHKDALYNAICYLDGNFTNDISQDDVARVALMSQSYFRYLFKQMTKKTFKEYLNDLRIARAIDLLKESPDMNVTDICYEVGYKNVNHFIRLFHNITGVTPRAYRRINE